MNAARILEKLPGMRALVVGDICLDRWCTCDPATSEPSRETGLPRIGVVSCETTPGAGGTIANNLAALGTGTVSVLGAIGDDGHGYELARALAARGIAADLLVRSSALQTFTYTKLLNSETGEEDRPRIDFINTRPLAREVETEVVARLGAAVEAFDVIFVSDQAETSAGGVVTAAVRDELAALALAHPEKTFWVDSRRRAEHFRNVCVKPNHGEAEAACLRAFGTVDYVRLRAQIAAPLLLVTHGDAGVLLIEDQSVRWVRTRRIENPVDICGAGDSFSAGAGMALAATGSAVDAARFGNLVASITIMKKGTGTASPAEVLAAADGER